MKKTNRDETLKHSVLQHLFMASLYTRLSLMGDLKNGTGDEGSGVDMPEIPLPPKPGSPSWLVMWRWMPENVLKT